MSNTSEAYKSFIDDILLGYVPYCFYEKNKNGIILDVTLK